ncbi:MAG: endonuclease/exonuclease/phosphatase family protein [Rehaibacterium terrae]|uniref:endonuclease/exonuclease/phosphatase family protein n=1 Tax=Rehaibacterium terrae TaxID=1341696 RepID=UPI00391942B9
MDEFRRADYNVSLYSTEPGGLIARLEAGDEDARKIAAVIQRQRPDVLLLNEFDYDADHRAADLFQRDYLEVGQHGEQPIRYAYRYLAPVNTGVPSGLDLDRDGRSDGPADAWGFGHQPGQYGMLVLSRHPIDAAAVRSFQHFRWKDLPDALEPQVPETGAPWYPPQVWEQLRLSSKSHWDVPVDTPLGRVHFLVSHPTPPVFDGPEDRNGRRNHDEIRLWAEYVSGQPLEWLYDDAGRRGGLDRDALFVIAGDLNADPVDGDSVPGAIQQLLDHPRVQRYPAPRSEGAVIAAETTGEANLAHRGDHAHDTGNFGPRVGNLRIDYVLPSVGLQVRDSGVFWPRPDEPGHDWTLASDHHMVWVDVVLEQAR